jgi:hypothetical protein
LLTDAHYDPGLRLADHEHELPGFTYVANGAFVESHRWMTLTCRAGDVIARPPDACHRNEYSTVGATCLLVGIEADRYRAIVDRTAVFEGVSMGRSASLSGWANQICAELSRADDVTPLVIEGLILQIASSLDRRKAKGSNRPTWLERVVEMLRDGGM